MVLLLRVLINVGIVFGLLTWSAGLGDRSVYCDHWFCVCHMCHVEVMNIECNGRLLLVDGIGAEARYLSVSLQRHI